MEQLPEKTSDSLENTSGDNTAIAQAPSQPALETPEKNKNEEQVSDFVPEYAESNNELDSFLSDATATHEKKRHDSEQKSQANFEISQEQATQYAVTGISHALNMVREHTGKDIKLSQTQLMLGSVSFVPLVMKYGPLVQQYLNDMAEGVDSDSYMPEYIAAGGAACLAGLVYVKAKKAPPIIKPDKTPEKADAKADKNGGDDNGD